MLIKKNNRIRNLLILIVCFLFIILLINIIISQNFNIPEIDKLPLGYKAVKNPDGTITITAPTETEYNELNINGHEFSMFPGASLTINKERNEIKTNGVGLIIINEGKTNEKDFGIINDELFDLIIQRSDDLARQGKLLKERSIENQISYVNHFRETGEALIKDPRLLPELSKQTFNSKHMEGGIRINQLIVRESSPAAKKYTIFLAN